MIVKMLECVGLECS